MSGLFFFIRNTFHGLNPFFNGCIAFGIFLFGSPNLGWAGAKVSSTQKNIT